MRNFAACLAEVRKQFLFLASFLFFSSILIAQTKVTGKVIGPDQKPVFGATVTVKGTNVATTTSADGVYSISMPAKTDVLIFSYIGYEVSEVNVRGNNTIDVSMKLQTTSLNEVVVTGYSAQRKKDITGAVAVVDVNSLKQIPTGNVSNALQGQASGVTVLSSGQPGGPVNVMVRGITSTGSAAPLVIIDGTPGGLDNLNVNDIESIQVLKDAGAAAIYGVRGSNGVVIVTTKKGRGRVRVSYDAYYGTQIPVKNGENPFNLANTMETGQAVLQSYANNGLTPPASSQYGQGTTAVIPDYIIPTFTMAGDPRTDPARYSIYNNLTGTPATYKITPANKQGTDWFNEIFDAAPIQSHNVSVGSSSDRSNFFLSMNYFNQQGTLMNTYLKRYSARINTMFNIASKVRVGENAYFFYRDAPGFNNQNEGNAISHTYRQNVIIPIYDIKGNFAGTSAEGLGNASNPYAIMARTKNNKANNYTATGNVFAEVDFLKYLTARTSFGGTVSNNNSYAFTYTAYENAENNTNPNQFREDLSFSSSYTWTNTLTFAKIFASDHNVKVLVGSEAIKNYGRGVFGTRNNYFLTSPGNLTVSPDLWTLNFGPPGGQTTGNNSGPFENRLFSLFGRVDYSYKDKYLLSGTLRRDGSSVFAEDARYGTFPSVTAGWRITRESFFPTVNWINELKLRGGWGKLGSLSNILQLNPYNAFSTYGQTAAGSYYDINGVNTGSTLGIFPSQIGNEKTTWEEDIVTNIGLDGSLFQNKLDFSIEWYKKDINGLLFRKLPDPVQQGPTQPFVNQGNIKNTGIDASVNYRGKFAQEWNFSVGLTFTSYNNEVVSLPEGRKYIDFNSAGSTRIGAFSRMQPGHPLGAFYGYEMVGLFQSAQDVTNSPTQTAAAPGRLKFKDVNGDGKINTDDRTFFGSPHPDFTAGISLGLNYRNFDFSTFLYASVGADVINYVKYWIDFPQVFSGAISRDVVYDSWTEKNPNAKVPRLERAANFSTSDQFNSYYMEDGSFLKMRSLIIGYTIPSEKLRRIGIDKFRVYVQGANLFTATKYKGLDPELINSDVNNNTNFGIDFGNYPSNQKNYNIGVNISF